MKCYSTHFKKVLTLFIRSQKGYNMSNLLLQDSFHDMEKMSSQNNLGIHVEQSSALF